MKIEEVWGLFKSPREENWAPDHIVVSYHGGVAVVTEESFDFRGSPPEITTSRIGENTPNGTYFFRHEASNPRDLFCFVVRVFQEGSDETKKIRRRLEESLRKNRLFLGVCIANS